MKTRRRTKGSCGFRKKLGDGEPTGTVRGESAMLTRSRSVARETVLAPGGALKSKIAQPPEPPPRTAAIICKRRQCGAWSDATVGWRRRRRLRSGGFSFPARIRRRARSGASTRNRDVPACCPSKTPLYFRQSW